MRWIHSSLCAFAAPTKYYPRQLDCSPFTPPACEATFQPASGGRLNYTTPYQVRCCRQCTKNPTPPSCFKKVASNFRGNRQWSRIARDGLFLSDGRIPSSAHHTKSSPPCICGSNRYACRPSGLLLACGFTQVKQTRTNPSIRTSAHH